MLSRLLLLVVLSAPAAAEERLVIEGHSIEGLITEGWAVEKAGHYHPSDELIAQGVFGWSEYVLAKHGRRLHCVMSVKWSPPELGPGQATVRCVEAAPED